MMPSYSHQTCITYEDVNSAFLDAKDKFGLPKVEEKFSIMDVKKTRSDFLQGQALFKRVKQLLT